jgi:hypothetical protein
LPFPELLCLASLPFCEARRKERTIYSLVEWTGAKLPFSRMKQTEPFSFDQPQPSTTRKKKIMTWRKHIK